MPSKDSQLWNRVRLVLAQDEAFVRCANTDPIIGRTVQESQIDRIWRVDSSSTIMPGTVTMSLVPSPRKTATIYEGRVETMKERFPDRGHEVQCWQLLVDYIHNRPDENWTLVYCSLDGQTERFRFWIDMSKDIVICKE